MVRSKLRLTEVNRPSPSSVKIASGAVSTRMLVPRLRPEQRFLARAIRRDVARDAEHAGHRRALKDRCVGHRQQAPLAILPIEVALVSPRPSIQRVLEMMLDAAVLVGIQQPPRAPAEQLFARVSHDLARCAVDRRERAVRVHGVNRVGRRLDEIAISRLGPRHRVARPPLIGHIAQRCDDARHLRALAQRRGRHRHGAPLPRAAQHHRFVPLRGSA